MAQIVTNYDLASGSTSVAAGTDVNNIRFKWVITGATAGQKVSLRPVSSEDAGTTFDNVLNENNDPFSFDIKGNTEGKRNSQNILAVNTLRCDLEIYCDNCTGTLNVYTYES